MIVFKDLALRNFLSYGNNTTIIQLERPGTTLIVGEDLDNTSDGEGSNGVGKSTLLNALVYALYDRAVSKISKDKLINNINKKGMEVTLNFIAENGKTYRIHRARKLKPGADGNAVSLFEDGVDISVDSAGTNKKIEDIIGIPYELFIRIVVFSASHTPFLDLPTTHTSAPNQKDLIEELFGLTIVSAKAEVLKAHIKDTKMSLDHKKARQAQLAKDHERHNTLVESALRRVDAWTVSNAAAIEQLLVKLEKVSNIDLDAEQALHAILSKLSDESDILTSELATERKALKALTAAATKVQDELVCLRSAKCPYCLQDFAHAQVKIASKDLQLAELKAEIDLGAGAIAALEEQLKKTNESYDASAVNVKVTNLKELLLISSQSLQFNQKITELGGAENPFVEAHQELVHTVLDPINFDDINALTVELEHQQFLLKLLTKSDSFVRKSLLNKNIPFLNIRLQYYLSMLGMPHTIVFTHEMTANISQFGNELDFGNLSTGQRARVDFALSVAFKEVRERLHGRTNICMFDEVLDFGLDGVGVRACAHMIKQIAKAEGLSMYIISHRNEIDSVFDAKMVVQLSKGFSYIREE